MTVKPYAGAYNQPNDDKLVIDEGLRVRNNAGNVAIAGATDEEVGLSASRCEASDEVCAVEPLTPGCIYYCMVDGPVTANANLYRAAGGKISTTVSGPRFGVSRHAASGDGSIIQVIYKGMDAPVFA